MAVQSFVLDRTVFQMMVAQPSVAGVPFLSLKCVSAKDVKMFQVQHCLMGAGM